MDTQRVKQVCIGQLALDDIVIWNESPQFNCLGGSALYSSLGMALWKENVGMIGRVGSDYDMNRLINIIPPNIVANIKVIGNHSRRVWVLHDELNKHYFVPKYASLSDSECVPKPLEISKEFLRNADLFHICPFPVLYQKELVEFLKTKGKLVTVDPDYGSCINKNGLENFETIFQNIDVFLPSEIEFNGLLGIENKELDTEDYMLEIKRFSDYFKLNVCILKRGEKGVILYDRLKGIKKAFNAIKVNVVDCTGAGDAFAGGFGYAYKFNRDALSSVKYGLISAAYTISGMGIKNLLQTNLSLLY